MIRHRLHSCLTRLTALATALLISNVAMLSCAMAFDISSDCPEPPPTHCVDYCDIAEAIVTDKSPDGTSDPRPPIKIGHTLLIATLYPASADINGAGCDADLHNPSPPLNLLHCVFLK